MGIRLSEQIVLKPMGLKHDTDLQWLISTLGRFGHTMLLDPGNMGLRGRIGNREAGLEAGLSGECEGRYAGSLWCTPSLSHFWQDCGRRVDTRTFHCYMRTPCSHEPVPHGSQLTYLGAKLPDLFVSLPALHDAQAHDDKALMHINATTPRIEHFHSDASISLSGSTVTRVSHGMRNEVLMSFSLWKRSKTFEIWSLHV